MGTDNATQNTASAKKIYRAGTLTYTFGGLVLLFITLLGGDFPWALKDRAIGASATLLISKFDISELLYSLIILAFPSFTSIFLCPILSYLSDRHRGRLGRRIPFLIFTTPFVVIGAGGLGFTTILGTQLMHLIPALSYNTACIICFAFFWVLLDFGASLAGCLSTALFNDVVPPEMLGRFFAFIRVISLGAGILFNYVLLGLVESYYLYIFVGVAALYAVGLTVLCTRIKEGEYPPPEPIPAGLSLLQRIFLPIMTYFRQCFSHPYYILLIVVASLGSFSCSPFNMYAVRFAKHINVDMAVYGRIFAYAYIGSFLLSIPLGWITDKIHPIRATMVSLICYGVTMMIGWFFVTDVKNFEIVLFFHVLISGIYYTVSASLLPRLFPRLLFAQFHSANTIMTCILGTISPLCFGILVDRFDYPVVFLICVIFCCLAVGGLGLVLKKFKEYGGDRGYVPPDPDQKAA